MLKQSILPLLIILLTAGPATLASPEADLHAFSDSQLKTGRPLDSATAERLEQLMRDHPDAPEFAYAVAELYRKRVLLRPGSETAWRKLLKFAVDQRYPPARAVYGYLIIQGEKLPRDEQLGYELLNDAIRAGAIEGKLLLGYLAVSGSAARRPDLDRAEQLLQEVMQLDALVAAPMYAQVRLARGHADDAVKVLVTAAEAGDPQAEALLASWYVNGQAVEKNGAEAFRWMSKAVEDAGQTRPDFTKSLADLHWHGIGTPADKAVAIELYKKAWEADDISAGRELARAYLYGNGVTADSTHAVEVLRNLAERDDVSSQLSLGQIYLEGVVVERDLASARKWLEKAAAQGDQQSHTDRDYSARFPSM